jgi:DNA polymerase I
MSKPPIIIDGDGVIVTACAAATKKVPWDTLTESLYCDIPEAQRIVAAELEKYQEVGGQDRPLMLTFSDASRRYFRHEVWPDYKGNRPANKIPMVGLKPVRDWAMMQYRAFEFPGLEADDVMGVMATLYMRDYGRIPLIISIDKDMRQIPCEHLRPDHLEDDVAYVTPEEAERFFWEQVLTGDSVDGYGGCKGVGPVKAKAILDASGGEYEKAARAAYEKAGHSEEYFIQMVNVARILTIHSFDIVKKEPILWAK